MVLKAWMRWRIERDRQYLKQEVGLEQCEGRGRRGSRHHDNLDIAAHGFLMAQRPWNLGTPSTQAEEDAARREEPALPMHGRPRGSPAHAAPRPMFHRACAMLLACLLYTSRCV